MNFIKTNLQKLLLCLCEIIVGILLLIDPVAFTVDVIRILGAAMILFGCVNIIHYFRTEVTTTVWQPTLSIGLLLVLLGLFCIFQTQWFIATFPLLTVFYGLIILLLGVIKFQWAVDMLRLKLGNWLIGIISAVLSISFAVLILLNPFSSTLAIWLVVALSLIAGAVLDILTLIFKKKILELKQPEVIK